MLRLDINVVFTIINLLIWFALARFLLFKPINEIISRREEAIRARYEDAGKQQEAAREEKEKYEACQEQMKKNSEALMEEAQVGARRERDRILEEAQQEADRVLQQAEKTGLRERERMVNQAKQEILGPVIETAGAAQKEKDDSSLYDTFLEKTGEADHGTT